MNLQVINVWFCVSLQRLPWGIVNETISVLLCCDLYSHFYSEARSCLCCWRYVCVARMVNLCLQPVFRSCYSEIKDLNMASHQCAWTRMKPERAAVLTVCLLRWRRWWLPASAAFPAVVGWLCHNPPAWGCGEFSKTGRCRFHLFNGKGARNDKASGMISPIHSLSHTDVRTHKSLGVTIAAPPPPWKWKTSEHNTEILIMLSCLL